MLSGSSQWAQGRFPPLFHRFKQGPWCCQQVARHAAQLVDCAGAPWVAFRYFKKGALEKGYLHLSVNSPALILSKHSGDSLAKIGKKSA